MHPTENGDSWVYVNAGGEGAQVGWGVSPNLQQPEPDASLFVWEAQGAPVPLDLGLDARQLTSSTDDSGPQLVGVDANKGGGTTLTATVDSTFYKERTYTYDWTFAKTADASALYLDTGQGAGVGYTLTSDRTVVGDTGVVTGVRGQVCVTNSGSVATQNLQVVVQVQWHKPSNDKFFDISGATVTVTPSAQLAAGATQCFPYDITFAPQTDANTYRVSAQVTITNHSGYIGQAYGPNPKGLSNNLPSATTILEKDGDADVADVASITSGWTYALTGTDSYHITSTGGGAALHDVHTFTETVTNANAACGSSGTFADTATLKESTSGASRSSSASVALSASQVCVDPSLSLARDRAVAYDWSFDKVATSPDLVLDTGQAGDASYTLSWTRSVASDSNPDQLVTGGGSACVTNYMTAATQGLTVTLQLQADSGSGFADVSGVATTLTGNSLAAGASGCYDYALPGFAPVSGASAYRVVASATVTNHPGHSGSPFGNTAAGGSVAPPALVITEQDESASVSDTLSCPADFSCSSSGTSFGIPAGDVGAGFSGSQGFTTTITNTGAACGTRSSAPNSATLTEGDTSAAHSAGASVGVSASQVCVSVSGDLSRDRALSYAWSLTKHVDPTSLDLGLGQSKTATYTLAYTRDVASDSNPTERITATGSACIANHLAADTDGLGILVTLQADTGSGFADTSTVWSLAGTVAGGSSDCFGFGPTGFDPIAGATAYRFTAKATVNNDPGSSAAGGSVAAPATNYLETGASASVKDLPACLNNFLCTPDQYSFDVAAGAPGAALSGSTSFDRTISDNHAECDGNFHLDNTATLTGSDGSETTASAEVLLVNTNQCLPPPSSGCTLTQGIWGNSLDSHAAHVKDLIQGALDKNGGSITLGNGGGYSLTLTTVDGVQMVLNGQVAAPKQVQNLWVQLLTAKLNILGADTLADPSDISSTLDAADSFLSGAGDPLSGAEKTTAGSLTSALDSWNTGASGPGHCVNV